MRKWSQVSRFGMYFVVRSEQMLRLTDLFAAMGMTGATVDLEEEESKFCFGVVGFGLFFKGQVASVSLEQGKIAVL